MLASPSSFFMAPQYEEVLGLYRLVYASLRLVRRSHTTAIVEVSRVNVGTASINGSRSLEAHLKNQKITSSMLISVAYQRNKLGLFFAR